MERVENKNAGKSIKLFIIEEDLPLPKPVFKNGKYFTTNNTIIKITNKSVYDTILIPEIKLIIKLIITVAKNNLNILK